MLSDDQSSAYSLARLVESKPHGRKLSVQTDVSHRIVGWLWTPPAESMSRVISPKPPIGKYTLNNH
jgi:hypothetical protein